MGPTAMSAQDSVYDQNALRVQSIRGDLQIVRGAQNVVVAHSGIFHGPRLSNLVTQSDSAVAEAKVFERNYQPGQYIAGLGIAMMGAAIGASRIPDINTLIPGGLTVASFALIVYGAGRLESAYRALSKAIWLYNRDLKR
jgi:F420-dependent methylenetetrahydromethanopterin dehydrogenase